MKTMNGNSEGIVVDTYRLIATLILSTSLLFSSCRGQSSQIVQSPLPKASTTYTYEPSATPSRMPRPSYTWTPRPTRTLRPTATYTPRPSRTPIPSGPVVLWEDDFNSLLDWLGPNHDKSVGCGDVETTDYNARIVEDDSSPSSDYNVLRLTSNATKRAGFYGNTNIYKPVEFVDGSSYIFSGYFKKGPGQPQTITVSTELIKNYVEHYAEILWALNPYGSDYGLVFTRNDTERVIPLTRLGDNRLWHYFEIQTRYDTKKDTYINERIRIDDSEFPLNIALGTFPKWWKESFQVALQVANMYPNCGSYNVTTGVALFDGIGVKRLQ